MSLHFSENRVQWIPPEPPARPPAVAMAMQEVGLFSPHFPNGTPLLMVVGFTMDWVPCACLLESHGMSALSPWKMPLSALCSHKRGAWPMLKRVLLVCREVLLVGRNFVLHVLLGVPVGLAVIAILVALHFAYYGQ